MTEHTTNEALAQRAAEIAAERARWAAVLGAPSNVQRPQRATLLARIFRK